MTQKLFFTIALFYSFLIAKGQLQTTKHYRTESDFCSGTIILDSLGYFYKESGCEGRSHISFGTYKLKGKIVEFSFQSFDSLKPISSTRVRGDLDDSLIIVTFLTKDDSPVPGYNFSVDAIDTSGKFFKTLRLNENGEIIVNPKNYKELRLDYLEAIFKKKVRIKLENANMQVILNLPKIFFYYSKPLPEHPIGFALLLQEDGLYDTRGKERLFTLSN